MADVSRATAGTSAREAFASRDYFYVGGRYVEDGTGNHVFAGQMYVEHLLPLKVTQSYPIVFIHGGGQTGSNWLNKPDGGTGWATRFLERGYEVYIIDKPARGRSHFWSGLEQPTRCFTAEMIQERFTATKKYMLWPQAASHTQWPDEGVMGGKVFDAYYATVVQNPGSVAYQQKASQEAGAALLDKIGPAILIAHSQGGPTAWVIGDARPNLVKAIVCIEPSGPPFTDSIFSTNPRQPWGLTDVPLTFSPAFTDSTSLLETEVVRAADLGLIHEKDTLETCILQKSPARQLVNLVKLPISLVTGESGYHAVYDWGTVEFLKQAGVHVDWLKLGDLGCHGNGHLMFMEKNSDEIMLLLEAWITKAVKGR